MGLDQFAVTILAFVQSRFDLFAPGDVGAGADNFDGNARGVAHYAGFITQPAIRTIFVLKAVFRGMMFSDQKPRTMCAKNAAILGMHALTPELRLADELSRTVSEDREDVMADEGDVARTVLGVDDGRTRPQQMFEAHVGGGQLLGSRRDPLLQLRLRLPQHRFGGLHALEQIPFLGESIRQLRHLDHVEGLF